MYNPFHDDTSSWYYNVYKDNIAELIPVGPNVILDLGCGTGILGRELMKANKAATMVGVEIFDKAARECSKYYHKVYDIDLEEGILPYDRYFDFIICGDIIEHLRDPWAMLKKIHGWLKDDGKVICSIPNVRYHEVIRNLVFFGKWEYVDAGVLDATHLRFFTRSSITKAFRESGYRIILQDMVIHGPKKNMFNKFTFRFFEEFLGSQVLVCAMKATR